MPIESVEWRYSTQWNRWFPEEFKKNNFKEGHNLFTIDPAALTNEIRQGSFLDVIGTNYYKASQLKSICYQIDQGRIKDGDIFFFHDLWFPGIEMIAYIRDALAIDLKICGIMHAGSYDQYDFLHRVGMTNWAFKLEQSWSRIFDLVFVATEFHKNLLCKKRQFDPDKVAITGLPIYPEFVASVPKRNIIVFPHRLDPEKQPCQFKSLSKILQNKLSNWQFVMTSEVCSSKQDYYDLLNAATISVSFSEQETWGIAMIESVMCGCIPVVPNRLSYQELYRSDFRFSSFRDCIDKIIHILDNFARYKDQQVSLNIEFVNQGCQAIPNMIEYMRELKE